ncbi:MAG: hypothetical protein JRH15_17475 [Deltaproteobacteria bacterium]|nr:hypothetical protein [Deltaproteobacteria bacterium]
MIIDGFGTTGVKDGGASVNEDYGKIMAKILKKNEKGLAQWSAEIF